MIFDELVRRENYATGNLWTRAFEFIESLDAGAEERRYDLQGDELYAVVESYNTRERVAALPEAHLRYADIQVLLSGMEAIECWATDSLSVLKPYNPDRDIAFFDRPDMADASLRLQPGRFAILFPWDAHMPGLSVAGGPAPVKKLVVKVAISPA